MRIGFFNCIGSVDLIKKIKLTLDFYEFCLSFPHKIQQGQMNSLIFVIKLVYYLSEIFGTKTAIPLNTK